MAAALFTTLLAVFLAAFVNRNGDDGDGLDGHIHTASLHTCNLVDHIEAFNDFAEHGVFAIQERCATHGLVGLTLTGTKYLAHTAFIHIQGLVVVHLALHDVELRATGGLLGVHLVALTGSGKNAFLVEVVALELGGDGVTRVEAAILVLTTLDHELVDDAMERRAVVPAFVHQLDEIVAMQRRVVIKLGFYGSHARLDDDDGFLFFGCLCLAGQADQNQSCDNQFLHISRDLKFKNSSKLSIVNFQLFIYNGISNFQPHLLAFVGVRTVDDQATGVIGCAIDT